MKSREHVRVELRNAQRWVEFDTEDRNPYEDLYFVVRKNEKRDPRRRQPSRN